MVKKYGNDFYNLVNDGTLTLSENQPEENVLVESEDAFDPNSEEVQNQLLIGNKNLELLNSVGYFEATQDDPTKDLRTYIEDNPEITEGVFGFAGVYPMLESGPTNGDLDCIGAVSEPTRVGIVEGYKSVCYKRSHFNDDFFENGYSYHYNDDLAVFAWLGLNGVKKWCIPYRFETSFKNRILSFPLKQQINYPKSGINHQRDAEGGSTVSYKKFYNTELGKGLQL